MITLTLDDKVYTGIPEGYGEMTVRQLIELTKAKNRDEDLIGLISAITGCDRDMLENMYIEDVNELLSFFNWMTETPDDTVINTIEKDGVTYVSKPNHLMTWGEQVSIETFLKERLDNADNFGLVLAILYRPGTQDESGKWKQNMLENDIDKIIERGEFFLDNLYVNQVYGVLNFFSSGGGKSSSKTSSRFSIQKEN